MKGKLAMLLAYLSASSVEKFVVPSAIIKTAQSSPHSVSRPTLTRGKRQMSQKSRANRRKASAKARRR